MINTKNLLTSLMGFYIINLGLKTNNKLVERWNKYMSSNRDIKNHVISFLFLFIFLNIFLDDKTISEIITSSFLIYILYIFTTKMDINKIVFMFVVMIIYLLYIKYNKDEKVLKKIDISGKTKDKIIEDKNKEEEYIFIIIIFVITFFSFLYFINKNNKYGVDFNIGDFLLK